MIFVIICFHQHQVQYTKATGPILPPSGINPNQLFLEQPKLNPNWYVIGQSKDFKVNQPTKVSLYGNPKDLER